MGYREPTFQDRVKSASSAKQKALDALKAKPAPTEEELTARREAQAIKDAAEAERRAAKKAEMAEAKRLAAEAKAAAALAKLPKKPNIVMLTEAERKAARDARYAARQARK
jgi:hypothetical protein